MIPETDYEYFEQHQGVYLDFESNPEGFERCTACQEPSEELTDGYCEYCYNMTKRIIMNTVIATAIPNKKYRWYENIANTILEARASGNQVRFYSVANKKEKCLAKQIVMDLFPTGCRINAQPFRATENKNFFNTLLS